MFTARSSGSPTAIGSDAMRNITGGGWSGSAYTSAQLRSSHAADLFRGVMDEGDLFASSLTADDIRGQTSALAVTLLHCSHA